MSIILAAEPNDPNLWFNDVTGASHLIRICQAGACICVTSLNRGAEIVPVYTCDVVRICLRLSGKYT